MTPHGIPTILVIDDELQDARTLAQAIGERAADVIPRTPDTFTHTDPPACRPRARRLRAERLGRRPRRSDVPTERPGAQRSHPGEQVNQLHRGTVSGVALHSGKVEEIAGRMPVELRGFALARLNNLEVEFREEGPDRRRGRAVSRPRDPTAPAFMAGELRQSRRAAARAPCAGSPRRFLLDRRGRRERLPPADPRALREHPRPRGDPLAGTEDPALPGFSDQHDRARREAAAARGPARAFAKRQL